MRMIGVTGACAAAGLVVGGITMTGLASKFSVLAFVLVGQNEFLILFLSAMVTIILGLGMPTPSAYVLSAVLVGPTLVNNLQLPEIGAHMFILYFAVLSAMTPPVAVASFAAAAIAQANPFRISLEAMQLAITAFVMPFAFIANPGMLHPWTSGGEAIQAITVVAGALCLAAGVETARNVQRFPGVTCLIGGLLLMSGWPEVKVIGCLVAIIGVAFLRRSIRQTAIT